MTYLIAAAVLIVLAAAAAVILRKKRGSKTSPLTVDPCSRIRVGRGLAGLFGRQALDDEFWSGLECTLIESDVGIDVTQRLLTAARKGKTPEGVKGSLSEQMIELLGSTSTISDSKPRVILVLGVNGVGKTTTIAKLAHNQAKSGRKVLLVAADTFRAAAVEQLSEWGKRLGCDVVAQGADADAAAVAFDGVQKAMARGYDVVIIDTAGRLHTKSNLMEELKKIGRVIGKAMPGAPHERLLVIDATVGSNGLEQARQFHDALGLTGIIVTKLDGTAKGGVVLAVANELKIPITHIGIGEGMEDLRQFDAREFVQAILG